MAHSSPPTEGSVPTEAPLPAEESPFDFNTASYEYLTFGEPAPTQKPFAQTFLAETNLVHEDPFQAPDDNIFFKTLKAATRLAQTSTDYYVCDSCFGVHPISSGFGAGLVNPGSAGDRKRIFMLLERLERAVANGLFQRSMFSEEEMDELQQTHEASVSASFMRVEGCEWVDEIREEIRRERISGARPPCMQRYFLPRPYRWIPPEPQVAGYFHMHFRPGLDGRRTPLAGLLHHHVQSALKRFRFRMEMPEGPGVSRKPSRLLESYRLLGSYKGLTEDVGDQNGEELLMYEFEPRIVEHGGQNMYTMKTTVTTGLATPISFCPHQVLTQIPKRGPDYFTSNVYRNRCNAKAGYSNMFFCPHRDHVQLSTSTSLFTFELKGPRPGSTAARMPGELEGIRDMARDHCLKYKGYPFQEVYAACRHCPTEIELALLDNEMIRFTVWQNFGAEGSALDPVWQSHIQGRFLQDSFNFTDRETLAYMTAEEQMMPWEENSYNAGPSVYAEPGAIRQLYDSVGNTQDTGHDPRCSG